MLREKTGEGKRKVGGQIRRSLPSLLYFQYVSRAFSASLLPSSLSALQSIPANGGRGEVGAIIGRPGLKEGGACN